MVEQIEPAGLPGVEEVGQSQTGLRTRRAARAAADHTNHHQWADGALSQMVVGVQAGNQHKRKQLVLMTQQPLGQGLAGMPLHAGRAQPQGVPLTRQPRILCFAIRGRCLGMRGHPRLGRVVGCPHRLRPPLDGDVLGMRLLQRMQIAQQVNPTTLVLAGIVVGADRAVTHQMAGELAVQDAFHNGLRTGPVVLIGTYRIVTGRAEAPDRAVLAVLAPPGLIAVQDAEW